MLSNDAKKVLYVLYKEYLSRRKQGASKLDAKSFPSAAAIREQFFPWDLLEDTEEALRELGRNELLNNCYADDTVSECELTDLAIVTVEKQQKETLLNIANFILKFKK